jgi:hypothetical protein
MRGPHVRFCERLHGRRPVVVASFRPTARTPSLTRDGVPFADPCRPPRVRTPDVLPLPAPIPLRSRLDVGRRVPWHAHPIGPACTGLHLRSVLQRASGFFPTRPRGARPDCLATLPPACSCLRLAVASNLLRRGLAPPIQGPCLAHQALRLRRTASRLRGLTVRLNPRTAQRTRGQTQNVPLRHSLVSRRACVCDAQHG